MTAEQSRRQFLRSTAGAGFGVAALVGEAQGSKFAALDRGATGSLDACQAADRAIGVLVANGFDDVFPRLFEIDLLAGDPLLRETLCADAVRYLLADRATSRPPFRSTKISWPKNDRQGFRRCALLDPRDAVIYLTAAILIAQAIEPHRLPIATNTVFSYRFTNTQGTLFNSSYNAEAFHAETLARLATDRRIHLVRTDIESFYPQIAHERLRSILRRCAVEQDCIDVVLRLLRAWQDADGRGIPIGQDASRILGEASLIEVDRALVAAGVDFTRFVDDYRLFAPDAATAHGWLDILTRSLAREQLTLNAAKTALDAVTRSEYATLSARRKLGPASLSGAFEQRAPACPPSGCRRPSKPKDQAEVDDLKQVDTADLLSRLRRMPDPDLKDMRLLLEASYQRGEFATLQQLLELTDRSATILPYLADFLIQESAGIPASTQREITAQLGRQLGDRRHFMDFEIICLARIMSAAPYRNSQALLDLVSSTRFANVSPAAARYVLAALDPDIAVTEAVLLEQRLGAADPGERRAIARLLLPGMNEDRRSTFVAQQREHADCDPYLHSLFAMHQG